MNCCRAWTCWLFLFATLVAQAPHSHDRATPLFAEEFGSCDESGQHWAGHDPVGDAGCADSCPLCQHRTQPMLAESALALVQPAPTATRFEIGTPRVAAGWILRARCRAPPEN